MLIHCPCVPLIFSVPEEGFCGTLSFVQTKDAWQTHFYKEVEQHGKDGSNQKVHITRLAYTCKATTCTRSCLFACAGETGMCMQPLHMRLSSCIQSNL